MFVADAHCDTLYNIAVHRTKPEDCCVTPERMEKGGVYLQTFAMFCSHREDDPFASGMAMKELFKRLPMRTYSRRLPDDVPAEIGTPAFTNASDGLKPFGFDLLREMDARGICADTSHLNERGFWDCVERARIAPCASHSNCRWRCDTPRNLKKEQVRALIDRKGYIGVNFYAEFLARNRPARIDDVIANIDEICSMGGEEIVGFGSDFDGIESWPDGLASPADFPALIEALRKRGYTQAQLERIAGLNYWRYLKDAEAAAERKA